MIWVDKPDRLLSQIETPQTGRQTLHKPTRWEPETIKLTPNAFGNAEISICSALAQCEKHNRRDQYEQ